MLYARPSSTCRTPESLSQTTLTLVDHPSLHSKDRDKSWADNQIQEIFLEKGLHFRHLPTYFDGRDFLIPKQHWTRYFRFLCSFWSSGKLGYELLYTFPRITIFSGDWVRIWTQTTVPLSPVYPLLFLYSIPSEMLENEDNLVTFCHACLRPKLVYPAWEVL